MTTTMLQNFIELLTIPFGAGESRLLHVSGQYFELIDATNPVDVLLIDKTGAQRGIMRGAEASFHLKNTDFATIQITSATAQTIRIGYGSGEAGTRRASGAVSIVGTVPVSGPLTDAQLRASPPLVRTDQLPGSSWNSTATMASNTPLTVFAPGANVNGAIIHALQSLDATATAAIQAFIAKAGAPVNAADGEVIAQGVPRAVIGSSLLTCVDFQGAVRISPGLGLYFISAQVGSAGVLRSARFTLL